MSHTSTHIVCWVRVLLLRALHIQVCMSYTSTHIVCRVRVELGQEIPEHNGLQMRGADENKLLPCLLETDRAGKPLLDAEGLVELFQPWDQVKDGSDDEDDDKCLARPGYGGEIPISNRAHGHHDEPECVKEINLDVIAEDVV